MSCLSLKLCLISCITYLFFPSVSLAEDIKFTIDIVIAQPEDITQTEWTLDNKHIRRELSLNYGESQALELGGIDLADTGLRLMSLQLRVDLVERDIFSKCETGQKNKGLDMKLNFVTIPEAGDNLPGGSFMTTCTEEDWSSWSLVAGNETHTGLLSDGFKIHITNPEIRS